MQTENDIVDELAGVNAKTESSVQRGIPATEVMKKLAGGEKLTVGEMARMRVRYFTDGLMIGGREFGEAYFEQNRDAVGSSAALKGRGCQGGLYSMPDLKVQGLRERPALGSRRGRLSDLCFRALKATHYNALIQV
jgi:hypothetical protein